VLSDGYYVDEYNIRSASKEIAMAAALEPNVMDPEVLRRAAGHAVSTLKLLANEERLLLLCQLTHGEMSVTQLEKRLQIRQPTLSQQLGVLRTEGVVKTRREGTRIFYSVADPTVLQILALLYRQACPQGSPSVIETGS
jgi:DNA-binding transcriptional ArsR family regulator